jgi:hypothetical protein
VDPAKNDFKFSKGHEIVDAELVEEKA